MNTKIKISNYPTFISTAETLLEGETANALANLSKLLTLLNQKPCLIRILYGFPYHHDGEGAILGPKLVFTVSILR